MEPNGLPDQPTELDIKYLLLSTEIEGDNERLYTVYCEGSNNATDRAFGYTLVEYPDNVTLMQISPVGEKNALANVTKLNNLPLGDPELIKSLVALGENLKKNIGDEKKEYISLWRLQQNFLFGGERYTMTYIPDIRVLDSLNPYNNYLKRIKNRSS